MAYFTKNSLQSYENIHRLDQDVTQNLRKAATDTARTRVFLSHSHLDIAAADSDDVKAARVLLASHGIDVYIDSEDPTLPRVTSALTADSLKTHIRLCDKFVLLATTNARNSKWVPWELGFADEARGMPNVAILPVADNYGKWEGNEYMGLYQRIMISDQGHPAIFPADSGYGSHLGSFL